MKKIGIDHESRNKIFRSLRRLEATGLADALYRLGVDLPMIRRVMAELNQSRQIDSLQAPDKALRGDKQALKTLDILGLQRPDQHALAGINKFLALVETKEKGEAELVRRVNAAKAELRLLRPEWRSAFNVFFALKGTCKAMHHLQSIGQPVSKRAVYSQFLKSKDFSGTFTQATIEAAYRLLMRHGAGKNGAIKACPNAFDEANSAQRMLLDRINDLERITTPSHVRKAVAILSCLQQSNLRDWLEFAAENLSQARKSHAAALSGSPNSNLTITQARHKVDEAKQTFAKALRRAVNAVGGKTGLGLAGDSRHLVPLDSFNFEGHSGKFDSFKGKGIARGNFDRASFKNAVGLITHGGSFCKADFSGSTVGTLRGNFSGARFDGATFKSRWSVLLTGKFDGVDFSKVRIKSPIDILRSSFRGATIRPEMVNPIINALAPTETIGLKGEGAELVREAQKVAGRAIAEVGSVLERMADRDHGLPIEFTGLVKRLTDMPAPSAISTMQEILSHFTTGEDTVAGLIGTKDQFEKLGEMLPLAAFAAKLDLAFNSIEAIKVRAARTTMLG